MDVDAHYRVHALELHHPVRIPEGETHTNHVTILTGVGDSVVVVVVVQRETRIVLLHAHVHLLGEPNVLVQGVAHLATSVEDTVDVVGLGLLRIRSAQADPGAARTLAPVRGRVLPLILHTHDTAGVEVVLVLLVEGGVIVVMILEIAGPGHQKISPNIQRTMYS